MIRSLLNRPVSQAYKNIFTLTTGTVVAQGITIAISPILTRIYEPSEFGNLALFVSLTNVFTIVATGRYNHAIMLPKDKTDAKNLAGLTVSLAFIFSAVLFLVVLTFSEPLAALFRQPAIKPWLLLLPGAVFLYALFQVLESYSNREKKYREISFARVTQTGFVSSSRLGMGFGGMGTAGMILSTLLGYVAAVGFLLRKVLRKEKDFVAVMKREKMKRLARQHRKFLIYTMPSNLFNNFSLQLPVFLLTSFFSSAIVGFYSLAHRIITLPMNLIGRSVSQVYYQNAAELRADSQKLKNFTFGIYKKLLYVGIVPFSVLGVWGDYLFGFVFGEEWIVAGQFAQYMSLWILFNFISSPISQLFSVLEIQEKGLAVNGLLFFFRLIPLLIGFALFQQNAMHVVILFSIVTSLFWIGFCFYLLGIAGVSYRKTFVFTFFTIAVVFLPVLAIRLAIGV